MNTPLNVRLTARGRLALALGIGLMVSWIAGAVTDQILAFRLVHRADVPCQALLDRGGARLTVSRTVGGWTISEAAVRFPGSDTIYRCDDKHARDFN